MWNEKFLYNKRSFPISGHISKADSRWWLPPNFSRMFLIINRHKKRVKINYKQSNWVTFGRRWLIKDRSAQICACSLCRKFSQLDTSTPQNDSVTVLSSVIIMAQSYIRDIEYWL